MENDRDRVPIEIVQPVVQRASEDLYRRICYRGGTSIALLIQSLDLSARLIPYD